MLDIQRNDRGYDHHRFDIVERLDTSESAPLTVAQSFKDL